jgi:GcrA cell cycle regulator
MAEWSSEMESRLRTLAAEGLSYGAIGREFGLSRNAVIAKAHRMNLPARPSPIVKSDALKPARRARGGKWAWVEAPASSTLAPLPVVADMPPPVAPLVPVRAGGGRECCWPMNNPPRGKPWLFCGAVTAAGKSYCAEHCALAYVQRPERSEAQREADELRRLSLVRRFVPAGMTRTFGAPE